MDTTQTTARRPRAHRHALGLALALILAQPAGASPTLKRVQDAPRPQTSHGSDEHARAAFAHLPLRFERNLGQTSPQVEFLARGSGYTLALTPTEAVFTLASAQTTSSVERVDDAPRPASVLRMRLEGADPNAALVGEGLLPGVSHYYIGSDPSRWRTNVPAFAAVRQVGAYPGIDLVYYGSGDLEYDFVLSPGADPSLIRLRFDGADRVRVDERGDLVLDTPAGQMRQRAPVVYQDGEDGRREVVGRYDPRGDEVGFAVGAYDPARPLVIDPVLAFSTYLGGGLNEFATKITVDDARCAYVTGYTISTDFPTSTDKRGITENFDGFVTKLNAAGTDIVYSVVFGGEDFDASVRVALDGLGGVYVAGRTTSAEFPTTSSAFQRRLRGSTDSFATKLAAADGSLLWSTYFGGDGTVVDGAIALAVDGAGDVYIAGVTASENLPLAGAYQEAFEGEENDGFLAKLRPSASGSESLLYSTYFGGTKFDQILSLAVDGSGVAYATGVTLSPDFPTRAPYQATKNADYEAFVAKIDPSSSGDESLLYSTYLGGAGPDQASSIQVDSSLAIYVAGYTLSTDFPTKSPYQEEPGGERDAFVTKLNPEGSALVYSTYLGGEEHDHAIDIAVDADGAIYVTGDTSSLDFPLLNPFQEDFLGGQDAFVTKLDPTVAGDESLLFSSNLGGGLDDSASGIAIDVAGDVYIAGFTNSTFFPVAGTPYQDHQGGYDGFVAKFGEPAASATDLTLTCVGAPDPATSGGQLTYTLTVSNAGAVAADVVVLTNPTPAGTAFASATASQGTVSGPAPGATGTVTCSLGALAAGASATVTIVLDVTAAPGSTVVDTATVTSTTPDANPSDNTATESVPVVAAIDPPDITSVGRLRKPFRVRIQGTNIRPGALVFVGDDTTPWQHVRYAGTTTVVVKGGASLLARFPKGTPVAIRVVNPDGGEDSGSLTR